jgi:hypothetical protein
MSLTIEQTDAAIRETFYNMEEGVEYVLNDFWFQEANRLRNEWGYSPLKNKQEYKLSRKGDQLFVNNGLVFDFAGKHNLALAFSIASFSFGFDSFAHAFAFAAFALALQYNGFEKLNKDTCDGKVVEIDGRKYKLTAV